MNKSSLSSKKPLVSIIIPVFNEEKNISACIKSLLGQTYGKKEIIIVDDGSQDNSKDVIKNFPVVYLEQNHLGPAKARNLGAEKSHGEILVFIDADMTFTNDFL